MNADQISLTVTCDGRIPVLLVTGYLGSGKTTLLNRLVRHEALAKSLVIMNEFGEIGIDHLLVSVPKENMLLLSNGCLCCASQGDLVGTFTTIAEKRSRGGLPSFDQVIIETSGLVDPVPIIQTLVSGEWIADAFFLSAVVTLVDALHGEDQIADTRECVKQVACADVLLITKSDLASPQKVTALRTSLERLNPGVPILDVREGAVDPDKLLRHRSLDMLARSLDIDRWASNSGNYHGPSHSSSLRHHDDIEVFCLYHDQEIQKTALVLWLNLISRLRGRNLLRIKGLLNVEGVPYVVQVVQTVVHEPAPLAEWPDDDRRCRLVFISRNIDKADIQATLGVFSWCSSAMASAPPLDPAAYTEFVRVARNFIQ